LLGLDCCHASGETDIREEIQSQALENLRSNFKDFAPAVKKLLMFVNMVKCWKLVEATVTSWVSKNGQTVLVGDAAHAALPRAGKVSLNRRMLIF
jgi:salicylate hydroxylase